MGNKRIDVKSLREKVQLVEDLGLNLKKSLLRNEGQPGLASRQTIEDMKADKRITQKTAELLSSAIQKWLRSEYPQKNISFSMKDLEETSYKEFCSLVTGNERKAPGENISQDPRDYITERQLQDLASMCAGFYECWMHWIDPKDDSESDEPGSSIYQFFVRIGDQVIEDGKIKIDEKKSVDAGRKSVKSYMSTFHNWKRWKNRAGAYRSKYIEYPWWHGELVPIMGHKPLLWFKFWSTRSGSDGKYCVISAQYEQGRANIEDLGLRGLLLAQPRYLPRHKLKAEPSCTRVFMRLIGSELGIDRFTDLLDKMGYLGNGSKGVDKEVAQYIRNDISKFKVLQSAPFD